MKKRMTTFRLPPETYLQIERIRAMQSRHGHEPSNTEIVIDAVRFYYVNASQQASDTQRVKALTRRLDSAQSNHLFLTMPLRYDADSFDVEAFLLSSSWNREVTRQNMAEFTAAFAAWYEAK